MRLKIHSGTFRAISALILFSAGLLYGVVLPQGSNSVKSNSPSSLVADGGAPPPPHQPVPNIVAQPANYLLADGGAPPPPAQPTPNTILL
jgi:hypothetical protein